MNKTVVGKEMLPHACGHMGEFLIFDQEQFPKQRRAKHARLTCPSCRKERAARIEAEQQAASAKRKAERQAADAVNHAHELRIAAARRLDYGTGKTDRDAKEVQRLPAEWELLVTRRADGQLHGCLTIDGDTISEDWRGGGSVRAMARWLAMRWLEEKGPAAAK
jgi:hypothetical protein